MTHYVLTRFNLRRETRGRQLWREDAWLRYRLTLWRRYCYATVRAQTCGEFEWLVLLDRESPKWLMTEMLKATLHCPQLVPLLCGHRPEVAIPDRNSWQMSGAGHVPTEYILSRVRDGETLLTTRLDSDDGVSVDFVERVQRAASGHVGAINCSLGWRWHRGLVLGSRHVKNPFISLCEVVRDRSFAGVHCTTHGTLIDRYPTLQITDERYWLMTLHGDNISNRYVGRLKGDPESRLYRRFPVDTSIQVPSTARRGLNLQNESRILRS